MDIHLYIYDLSNGLARSMSVALTGTYFDAIYHTSVVLDNREYFFGGSGIESCSPPGQGHSYGSPIERRKMGTSDKSLADWQTFLNRCGHDYGVGKYHLLEHNCNTFSDHALQFLLNVNIPAEISSLPATFLATPFGKMFRPQIDAMYAPNANIGARTEVPISGPTSSAAKQDHAARETRSSEAFRFLNTPTLSKVFGKIKTQDSTLDEHQLEQAETYVASVLKGSPDQALCKKTLEILQQYMQAVPVAEAFPVLDLLRLLVTDAHFADLLAQSPLLKQVLTLSPDQERKEDAAAYGVLLKLLGNMLIQPRLGAALKQDSFVQLVEQMLRETVAPALLHASATVRNAGLKTMWNALLLAPDAAVTEDFRVACLASVDAMAKRENEGGAGEQEERTVMRKVVKELMAQGGMETLQMADVLEINI